MVRDVWDPERDYMPSVQRDGSIKTTEEQKAEEERQCNQKKKMDSNVILLNRHIELFMPGTSPARITHTY